MKLATAFGAICLTLGISSCSDEPKSAERSRPKEAAEVPKLRILSWEDYTDPQILAEFTELTGIETEVIEFSNSEELIAMFHSRPEDFDVVTVDAVSQVHLQELGLLKEIDHSKLGNLSNVGESFLSPAWDPENRYSIPYLVGATIVAYRKDKIPDPQKSWSLLFDPKYKGRVALLDEYDDLLAAVLQMEGHSARSQGAGQIDGAKQRVLDHIAGGGARFGSFNDSLEALDSGEIWAAMNYNGDTAQWAKENPAIDYFVPKEGSLRWMDSFVVSRDADAMESVYAFLDFMMEGKVAAQSASKFCLVPANRSAFPHLPADLVSDSRIFLIGNDLAKSEMLLPVSEPSVRVLYAKAMNEIAAARRKGSRELVPAEVHEERALID